MTRFSVCPEILPLGVPAVTVGVDHKTVQPFVWSEPDASGVLSE